MLDTDYVNASQRSKRAYFSKKRRKSGVCFSEIELIEAVNLIIDNSYINFKDNIYKQIIGIPMGTNCAPHLANIYLHVYEYKYLQKLVHQKKIDEAKQLSNVFRYQDDCIAINDNNLFSEHAANIYPREMILKKTNITVNKTTFLDLTISIFRNKFLHYSWDKRRDFKFQVMNYPHMSGNIPSGPTYGVYTSQLVRFCDINMSFNHFVTDIKVLTSKFIAQGFLSEKLKDKFVRFRNEYYFKWAKYNTDISSCVNKVFGINLRW